MVLLEDLLRKVDPKLLTFPFHLKTGTYVFTPYRVEGGAAVSWFREMWDSEGGGKLVGHPLWVKFFGGGDP